MGILYRKETDSTDNLKKQLKQHRIRLFECMDAIQKEKTRNIGEGFQSSMADNRGAADFDALSGKKTAGGGMVRVVLLLNTKRQVYGSV